MGDAVDRVRTAAVEFMRASVAEHRPPDYIAGLRRLGIETPADDAFEALEREKLAQAERGQAVTIADLRKLTAAVEAAKAENAATILELDMLVDVAETLEA